jgi:hypothetical protein
VRGMHISYGQEIIDHKKKQNMHTLEGGCIYEMDKKLLLSQHMDPTKCGRGSVVYSKRPPLPTCIPIPKE